MVVSEIAGLAPAMRAAKSPAFIMRMSISLMWRNVPLALVLNNRLNNNTLYSQAK
jgi:hypothetical protein